LSLVTDVPIVDGWIASQMDLDRSKMILTDLISISYQSYLGICVCSAAAAAATAAAAAATAAAAAAAAHHVFVLQGATFLWVGIHPGSPKLE